MIAERWMQRLEWLGSLNVLSGSGFVDGWRVLAAVRLASQSRLRFNTAYSRRERTRGVFGPAVMQIKSYRIKKLDPMTD